jgi:hypothetical protein
MAGADVPALLARAYWEAIRSEAPDFERRRFLRRVAEGAVGGLPGGAGPDPATRDLDTTDARVATAAGVALAIAVADQFSGPDGDDPVRGAAGAGPGTPAGVEAVTGRAAARELVRRAGRRVRRAARLGVQRGGGG